VHARRSGAIASTLLTPSRRLQDGVNEDGLSHRVPGFKLRQKLVEVVDVPAPSTLGSMMTSSLPRMAATISITSSSAQGELSALMRVHNPVAPKSFAFAIAMNPRAPPLWHRPGWRLPDCRGRHRPA